MTASRRRTYLDRIIDTLADGLVIVGTDGRFEFANAAAGRIVGRPPGELIGRSFEEGDWRPMTAAGKSVPASRLPHVRALRTRRAVRGAELSLQRPDGARIMLSVNAAPLLDDERHPIGAAVSFTDITARSAAERRWRDSEERFRRLAETAQEVIFVVDRQGRIDYINKAGARLVGRPEEELLGRRPTEIAGSSQVKEAQRQLAQVLEQGHSIRLELGVPKRHGTVWLESSLVPLKSARGQIVGAVGIARDVTERKVWEQALATSEARLSDIIDNTSAMIYVKDLEGRFVLVNREFERLFGIKATELVGKTSRDIFPEDMAAPFEARDQEVLDTGKPIKVEEGAFVGGDHRTYVSVKFPLRDAQGDVYGVCGISTDITELEKAQEELKRKDLSIRRVYADVFGAVTGNRLVLLTLEEIEGTLGKPLTRRRTITKYEELAPARAHIARAVRRSMPQITRFNEFIVGVSEALTNAVKHTGGATYRAWSRDGTLQVTISDEGPGIDFKTLPSATLETGFSTKGSLGVGFTLMLELSNRVLLSTQPGKTLLVLETDK